MVQENKNQGWFEHWFDSPYYHILYKNRDFQEAATFLERLLFFFSPSPAAKVLDLACGKGRHARFLSGRGLDVIGTDLSSESIAAAKVHENDRLAFHIHDMRVPFLENHFGCVFNLFTSFGYFEEDVDNYRVIGAAEKALVPKGYLLIDFMNVHKVINGLVVEETRVIDGISFCIQRKLENGRIIKTISFEDQGQSFSFTERVQALALNNFEQYLAPYNFKITNVFGNYQLQSFTEKKSDRLIIIAQKGA